MGISEKEYLRRYTAIKTAMAKDSLDSLLVYGLSDDFNRGNIRYITGSGRGGCCIFPIEGKPVFFVSPNQSQSPKLPKILEAVELLDLRETSDIPGQVVKELSCFDRGNRIGLLGLNCIPVRVYLKAMNKFGKRLVDTPEFLRPLRDIKSTEEIQKIKVAAHVADSVYARLRAIIRPGMNEYSIYGEVKKVIYKGGCDYSFDLLDAAGSMMNMSFFPTRDKLETNGTLFMEISPAFEGYYAQLPVTLPVGNYLPHVRRMVKAWDRADQAVRKILVPGTKASEVYTMLVNCIMDSGFLSPLRPGHSIGLDILDFWSFTESNNSELKAGMVVAVHPSCMVEIGGDGIGMGYTYLITDNGPVKLSKVDLAAELLSK